MKEEVLLKLVDMLVCGESKEQVKEQQTEKQMIGDYVIVRCRDAGVHAGYLVSYEGREVVLSRSRRLWYWKAAKGHTLSAVAEYGITSESKIPAEVKTIVLPEACEIIFAECGRASIQGAKEYEVN